MELEWLALVQPSLSVNTAQCNNCIARARPSVACHVSADVRLQFMLGVLWCRLSWYGE